MKAPRRRPALKLMRLAHAQGLPLPAYQSAAAAGFDLAAALPEDAPVILAPGQRSLVPTGLVFELTEGYEVQVRPRSGLAMKFGVTVLNSPGTIDADYRGEVAVILVNLGVADFVIARGDRIAQAVVAMVVRPQLSEASRVGKSGRGAGGFGSTGISARQAKSAVRKRPERGAAAKSKPKQNRRAGKT